jgi:hypothetical protein
MNNNNSEATIKKTTFINNDSSIEKLLQEAYLNCIRNTDEYQFGRFEERMEKEKELFRKSFEKAFGVAEAFFKLIKSNFSEIKIEQFRIGVDYSSRVPAILMIISEENQNKLNEIRLLARNIELVSWGQGIADCYIWTKINKDIDNELIETDFPFARKDL